MNLRTCYVAVRVRSGGTQRERETEREGDTERDTHRATADIIRIQCVRCDRGIHRFVLMNLQGLPKKH